MLLNVGFPGQGTGLQQLLCIKDAPLAGGVCCIVQDGSEREPGADPYQEASGKLVMMAEGLTRTCS